MHGDLSPVDVEEDLPVVLHIDIIGARFFRRFPTSSCAACTDCMNSTGSKAPEIRDDNNPAAENKTR